MPSASRALFSALLRTQQFLMALGISRALRRIPLAYPAYAHLYRQCAPRGELFVHAHGHKLFLDPRDMGMARALLLHDGRWEEAETRLFSSFVKEGMTVVDIGANVGYYTLLAARLVGPRGKVYAFEPSPVNFELLKKNVQVNGYTNVVLVNKAVSHETAKARLALHRESSGTHNLFDLGGGAELIEVETVSLDDYFAHERIDVAKIDAEGAEIAILDGARQILDANPDLILFAELFPRAIRAAGHAPEELIARLDACGFQVYPIDERGSGLEPFDPDRASALLGPRAPEEGASNLVCLRGLPAKRLATLSVNLSSAREKLISICIPTFNRARYLPAALESILPQLGSDVELLVYDTGSTDGTQDLMATFVERFPAIRSFSLDTKRGFDETALLLFEQARGEYVWFFGSDDILMDGAIDAIRESLARSAARPSFIYLNHDVVDRDGRLLVSSNAGTKRDRKWRDGRRCIASLNLHLGYISACIFRREDALPVSEARPWIGSLWMGLFLNLRALSSARPALYLGWPMVRARRNPENVYDYGEVFCRKAGQVFWSSRRSGISWFTIFRAMNCTVRLFHLRFCVSRRCDAPPELSRAFPAIFRTCWIYPWFWLLIVPVRLAPSWFARVVRNRLRRWRDWHNVRLESRWPHPGNARSANRRRRSGINSLTKEKMECSE